MRLFLEGRHKDLAGELEQRVESASQAMRYEEASALHELLRTVEEMGEKQKMAAAEGSDTDIFAYYAEPPLVAVNLFHLRHGHIVDRREFFWEDQREFDPNEFFASLLKQVYLNEPYVPAFIHVPVEFEDRDVLEELLSERRGRKVEINTPQRGQKKAMLSLVEIERAPQLRAAFPRAEAVLASDTGSAARRTRPGKRAQAHRVFRYFPHSGYG